MTIKILHLYKHLMNLYGEYTNVAVLKAHLMDQGATVELNSFKSIGEVTNLSEYDFIYIGAGNERSQKVALEDLITRKSEIQELAKNGTVMLFTGNAIELLGKTITDCEGNVFEALEIANFTTFEQNVKRIQGDCYCNAKIIDIPVVGYVNKASSIEGIKDPLFEMILGHGNNEKTQEEGYHKNNVYATYVTGPILVKNPELMNYFVSLLCTKQDSNFTLKDEVYPYEVEAYRVTEERLLARISGEDEEESD